MIPIKSSWIRQKTIKINHLDELLDQFERSDQTTYSVSWVDCMSSGKTLGRSLLMLGEHADPEELPNSLKENAVKLDLRQKLNVPFHLPSGILNSWSIKSFNSLYYHRIQNKRKSEFVPLLSYFYPLDSVHQWNRIYGKKGFYQYQCVIPKKLMEQLFEKITSEHLRC